MNLEWLERKMVMKIAYKGSDKTKGLTLQNIVQGATADQIKQVADAFGEVVDGSVNEVLVNDINGIPLV